ncbi:MAG: MTAP family purine nucleoside phosphorylase, partial [Myxococcota bacterium]
LMPSEIPYRANIYALKSLGVDTVISVSAVGSMREELHPGDVVLPTQYVDRTRARPATFFGDGLVAHVSLADPVCPWLVETLSTASAACGLRHKTGGTYICIDGPAFSTRAESNIFRSWGVDIIGMTALPEARLAREAEMHYATLALVTDYDCWHATEAAVSVDDVIAVLRQNSANVQRILQRALPQLRALDAPTSCSCTDALRDAIITARDAISQTRRDELAPIVSKYLG